MSEASAGAGAGGGPAGAPAPERVLIIGDSMVVTELGRDLARRFESAFGAQVIRRGKSSTGLARPDFFNWFEEGRRLARDSDPEVVVVIVGGNDGQDLVDEAGRGRVRWRSEDWEAQYAQRVHRFLDAMASPGRRFVWIDLPAMEHRRLEGKLELIRKVQAQALAERDDVLVRVDHGPCFLDGEGRILTAVPEGPGKGRKLRQDDGIHLSLAGARYVSRCTAPQVFSAFDGPSPRT